MADDRATYEELCEMIETGMDADQACLWAAQHGLRITEEQRDHLERDLEAFDTSMLLDVGVETDDALDEEAEPVASPAPERDTAPQKPQQPELKHLTPQERRNFVLGVFIVLAVAIAVVRFITT